MSRFLQRKHEVIECSVDKIPQSAPNSALPIYIKNLIKGKNNIRCQYQRKRTEGRRILWNKLSCLITQAIINWKNGKWDTKLTSLNPQDNCLWKMTNYFTKRRSAPLPPVNDGKDISLSNVEKAEALVKQFEKHTNLPSHLEIQLATTS